MKTPAIAKLTINERHALMEELKRNELQDSSRQVLAEAIDFINTLTEDLKTSKVSIHKLKQLLGFHSEQLKKVIQSS